MYLANEQRYQNLNYRKIPNSGLVLPPISLGCWHNFGDQQSHYTQRQILYAAFDSGINHFDLANNYGTPYGSAELNIGRFLQTDFKPYRDELVISTKAGWDMWPGPYGQGGGSRKYLIASVDQSLKRLGLDYVDIFYSHRYDPDTPLAETAAALADIVKQGKALYIGISSGYSSELSQQMIGLLAEYQLPLNLHQSAYNLMQRDIEQDLLATAAQYGFGMAVFSPLAQGLLAGRYLHGIAEDSRIARGSASLQIQHLVAQQSKKIAALQQVADHRQQSLAQMALAWVLRQPQISTAIIGASKPQQLLENIKCLDKLEFCSEELNWIEQILNA